MSVQVTRDGLSGDTTTLRRRTARNRLPISDSGNLATQQIQVHPTPRPTTTTVRDGYGCGIRYRAGDRQSAADRRYQSEPIDLPGRFRLVDRLWRPRLLLERRREQRFCFT